MIVRALRWIGRLDRSYFLALSAFVAAIVASIFVAFAPATELPDGSTLTLIEDIGMAVLILIALPVLVLAAPLLSLQQTPGPRRRSDKINAVASTGISMVFVVALLASLGLFYLPAVILSVASTVSLFFGRRERAGANTGTGAGVSAGSGKAGARISRSALKRAREEKAGETQEISSETPLTSSRRRRGKKRRRR